MTEQSDQEEEIREYLREFLKWWSGGSASKRLGLGVLTLGMAAPFVLGITAIVVVIIWVAPAAVSFTDRLAVFGVLFGLLTAIAVQIASVSQRMVFGLFFTRHKRKSKSSESSTEP